MPAPNKMNENNLHAGFRFRVKIDNINAGYFIQVNLPSIEVETTQVREGGYQAFNHTMPQRVKWGNLRLKRHMSSRHELLKWYMETLKPERYGDMLRTITLTIFDSMAEVIMEWTFYQAYPVKYQLNDLDTTSTKLATEEIEIAFTDFQAV